MTHLYQYLYAGFWYLIIKAPHLAGVMKQCICCVHHMIITLSYVTEYQYQVGNDILVVSKPQNTICLGLLLLLWDTLKNYSFRII